jgi:DNA invertase Pin-like site-specific DNA recombinase|tara:strand:+ start:1688 stop:2227 length:540 start_codon:yes stop_codon:yes gene_type:complete
MSQVGYARVSSAGQSLDVQLKKLAGCDKIFKEKTSGATATRPQLAEALNYVRSGDTLVITKLDRLARSTLHLTNIADKLKSQGVELVVIDQAIDTSTPTGKLLFNMLASIAEFETEIRRERQLDGISLAQNKGVKFGAKAKLSDAEIEQMKEDRLLMTVPELMSKYKLSKSSVYRLLNP